VFSPGNPPASKAQKRDHGKPEKPDYLGKYGDEIISSGCKCLDIPQKTTVISKTATQLSTTTVSETVVEILPRTDFPTEHNYDNYDTPFYIYGYKHKDSFAQQNHPLPCVFHEQCDSCIALTPNSVCYTSPNEGAHSALWRCLIPEQPWSPEHNLLPQRSQGRKRPSLLQHLLLWRSQLRASVLLLLPGLRCVPGHRAGIGRGRL
jgi:hypothetical protein